ncbi:hypothetical protein HBA91_08935 [Ochrobactrum sp. MR34]|nr:hypothetical protein [Ochrobactrum sp. MR34]
MNKKNLICFGQCVAAGIVGAFITHILIQFFGEYIEACKANEPNTHCTREWVSALSGWIAAIGAIFAALITLPHLRQQAAEAKRQADFVLGDAYPTLTVAISKTMDNRITLRIVNWNKHPIFIRSIRSLREKDKTAIAEIRLENVTYPQEKWSDKQGWAIERPIFINGWENRNNPPHFIEIDLWAIQDNSIVQSRYFDGNVGVDVILTGDNYREFLLHGSIKTIK